MKKSLKIQVGILFALIMQSITVSAQCGKSNNWASRTIWDSQSRWDETPSIQVSVMGGIKAGEISVTYTHSVVLGLAASIVSSSQVEKRIKNNGFGQKSEIQTSKVPTVFGLIGGEFENLSMIGKIGGVYVDQKVSGVQDPKKLYLAVGMEFSYKINDVIALRASYDNINSILVGGTINFKM